MQEKKTQGGKRKGAGRKPEFGERTTTIAFRVPESKEQEIRELVSNKLDEYRLKNEN